MEALRFQLNYTDSCNEIFIFRISKQRTDVGYYGAVRVRSVMIDDRLLTLNFLCGGSFSFSVFPLLLSSYFLSERHKKKSSGEEEPKYIQYR